tara:strand:- start:1406 stop:2611 length:1206 start_codon:yes stop_codon:yes gene_type:complete
MEKPEILKLSKSKLDLVILAGGKGSRIKSFLGKSPKPMLKFNSKNFIQYILNKFSKYNFKRILILTGYRGNVISKKYNNTFKNFIKISCIREKKIMGTGGALHSLKKLKVKDFVLVNGDTIFDINLKELLGSISKNSVGSIALIKNKNLNNKKLNNLKLVNNYIASKNSGNLMNGGTYYFKKNIFKYVKKSNISLENKILPFLLKKKIINGKVFDNFFLDIGTREKFKLANKKLKLNFKKKAIFLDRDGVINYDYGYVHDFNNFKFKKNVIKGLKLIIKKNYHIFIVTNQAGIAKGIFSEKKLVKLHKKLKEILCLENIYFDDVLYSPFHPKGIIKRYKGTSDLRKPGTGMIKILKKNWDIDYQKSLMIGDKKTDEITAKKSNLRFFYAEQDFLKQIKKII